MRLGMSDCNFYTARFEYPPKWCTVLLLHGWCHVKLLLSRRTFCLHHTEPCISLQCRCSTPHTYRIYIGCMCLAVTCHQRFWQNDRFFLRASAVTRGWNGYQNKSQHRKLNLEKKILPPLLSGLETETLRSRVRRSTTELSPLPLYSLHICNAAL